MKVIRLFALLLTFCLGGCALQGFDRTYSFVYTDKQGQAVSASINLRPTRGLAK